jgi:ubiquinone/menaquinone biosynthesis C-methylase UbiE
MVPNIHSSPQQPPSYYSRLLSAERLKQCYDTASPRIRQYLEKEVNFVIRHLTPVDIVLDVGCGYGRIIPQLAQYAKFVMGIDVSRETVRFGKEFIKKVPNGLMLEMNAKEMSFTDNFFDVTLCIQNGLSAFHVDPAAIIQECVRVTKKNGRIFLSTYAPGFWEERLNWFKQQSAAGLIGEIDSEKTQPEKIICKDGFSSTTVTRNDFIRWAAHFNLSYEIEEVDESSLFCILKK